jgi:G:T-mismatch repair DNA endonuclease (very short patch repair protein)
MSSGTPNNGLPNPSWFKKGQSSPTSFKKGDFIPKRSKESYERGTAKMVQTRKREGSYTWSAESKEKARQSHLGKVQPWSRDNVIRLMAEGKIKKFNTKPELKMKELLDALGVAYVAQKIIHGFIVDFFLPSKNLIVEVDGEYWHGYPNGLEKDRVRDEKLVTLGYKVVRFWAKDVMRMSIVNI